MYLNEFLPITKKNMKDLGWEELDFIIVSGDAYVDHPSFGHAIISRILVKAGYKVGIIPQPNWKNTKDIKRLGKPRLGFLVSPGNIDSMVNHFSVNKKRRKKDLYSPGGNAGYRPDRPAIVYTNLIKQAYKDVPVIIGGIEASLRRFAHYDYWKDTVRRSILLDSKADLLIYGMGENQVVEIANYLNEGIKIDYIHHVPGTCFIAQDENEIYDYIEIPSFEEVSTDKDKYAKAFIQQYREQDAIRGQMIVQRHGDQLLVQNPPAMPLTTDEMDIVYGLPYQRDYHPSYKKMGGIPAIREVKFSITSQRGCYGGCSFCAITSHQGRRIQSRSHESIIEEAKHIIKDPDFKGYIHDIGGPTANFREVGCDKQLRHGTCKDKQCLFPKPCNQLKVDHSDYLSLLRKLRSLEGVKKVFIKSGIRYDYLMADQDDSFFWELCKHHISGQLKVAPEHIVPEVLDYMGKPSGKTYDNFVDKFYWINKKLNKEQYVIPYLMSSHPGSTLKSAIELAVYLKKSGFIPDQVQDFYPTPGTLSTCMYYTEIDPRTMKKVYVAKTHEEKKMQRALLQFNKPWNKKTVLKALKKENRYDLIGKCAKCLVSE